MVKRPSLLFASWLALFLLFPLQGNGQTELELRERLKIRDQFNLAISFYHRMSYGIAIPHFIEVLKKDSDHFFARYYLSLSFFRNGRTDEAIREMENLIRIHGLNRNLESKINFFSQQKFIEQERKPFNRYVWIRDYPNPESQNLSLKGSLNPFSLLRKQGYRIRTPIHLRVTRNNELEVLDFSLKKFSRLDGDGVLLEDIYKNFSIPTYNEQLGGPWAFAAHGNGFWITDFLRDNIKVINQDGGIETVYGSKGIGETNFLGIKGITTDENGNFYIADSGNGRIQFRNQRGEWLKNIGQRGDEPGALLNPVDAAYDQKNQQLYVLDKGHKKVVIFSQEGEFLDEISQTEMLSDPQKLLFDAPAHPSHLYILDQTALYRYWMEDNRLEEIQLQRKSNPLQFVSLALGEDGYLYLGNALREKIEVFAPVEKTYVNLPVLVKAIHTQRFPFIQLEVEVKDLTGHPIKFLQSRNFSLYENNVALPFTLLPTSNPRKIILLVEKSTAAQDRTFTIQALMGNLFDQLSEPEGIKVITYNQNGHTEQTPFSLFKLAAAEKATQNDYTPTVVADSALLHAVNHTKVLGAKNAVVMLVFSPYQAAQFRNRYIDVLQTLKNNDIPVYIFYAGPENKTEDSLFYLRNLSIQTGGRFYTYDEQSLDRFENDFNHYHNGVYTLQYLTTSDPKNRGVFRRVAVDVRYKNSQGEDGLAGYPVP